MSATNDLSVSNESIVATLNDLPKQLFESDVEIAQAENSLGELRESLEIAKTNAALNANPDGKNAEQRALQLKSALAKSAEVKEAQKEVSALEAGIAEMQAQNKMLSRQFAGLCHIAELKAAHMILMSKGATK